MRRKLNLISALAFAIAIGIISTTTSAQEVNRFATKGVTELGGNILFESTVPVVNGETGDATTIFALNPFIGYFISDGFELGVDPFGIVSTHVPGSTTTQVTVLAAPSYNWKTEGVAYPFIEGLVGFTSESDGSSRSGFTWGGRGGVKLAITDKGLLNFGVEYLQITTNPSGAVNRYGSNDLSVSGGFTVWL